VHVDFQPFGDDGDVLNLSRVDVLNLSEGYGFKDEEPLLPLPGPDPDGNRPGE
jgi:hypothetical protein